MELIKNGSFTLNNQPSLTGWDRNSSETEPKAEGFGGFPNCAYFPPKLTSQHLHQDIVWTGSESYTLRFYAKGSAGARLNFAVGTLSDEIAVTDVWQEFVRPVNKIGNGWLHLHTINRVGSFYLTGVSLTDELAS